MTDDNSWFLQVNFKIGDDLFNVRGENVEHLGQNLVDLREAIADIVETKGALAASGLASRATRQPGGSGEAGQESQAGPNPPARQRGGAPSRGTSYGRKKTATTGGRGDKKPKLSYAEASADCQHGERRRFAKDDWVAYFCPLEKDDPNSCAANFLDAGDDEEA